MTTDLALRLSRAFSATPDLWLNLQRKCDLWAAEQEGASWQDVPPLPSLEAKQDEVRA